MFPHRHLISAVMAAYCLIASAHAQTCACGYSLSAYGNAYFQKALVADFTKSTLSGTATSSSWLESYGLYIADGYGAGGVSSAPDHTQPIAHYKNVRIQNKTLQLVVPGGQKITNGGQTSVAQVEGPSGIISGVFTMNAKIDATPGTDQAFFTYHGDTGTNDEQDIEILGSYLYKAGDNGTPSGIELTNWDPTDPNNTREDYRIDPFPSDPAARFHNYTIAWLPNQTTYYMDKTALNSPTLYRSTNPSTIMVNHWTNGDPAFTQGPPTSDVVLQIKQIVAYYSLQGQTNLPSGCVKSQVCVV